MDSPLSRWWAIIGIAATPAATGVITTPHDKTRKLATEFRLGPLLLRPGERRFIEYLRNSPQTLSGYTTIEFWPVIVEGESHPPPSLEFDEAAFGEVRRAAALLALAWCEPWHIRSGPAPTAHLPPRVPDSDNPPLQFMNEPLDRDPDEVHLPQWLGQAWDMLSNDPALWSALLTWHEGILLEAAHPSMALVAYTAAVETTGYSSWVQDLGIELSAGSGLRFRELLALVTSDDEQRRLVALYPKRSSTVHGSRLHGIEPTIGAVFDLGPRMQFPNAASVSDPNVQEFVMRTVPLARSATRRLLIRALGDTG